MGFGSVEPSDVAAAVAAVGELAAHGMRGVTVDPSTAQISRRFNDRALCPIYEEAQRLGLIVSTTMSCLLGPYQDDCCPEYVAHVATDFPGLTVFIQHGGWPYVREALGVAYKQPNVVIVPAPAARNRVGVADERVGEPFCGPRQPQPTASRRITARDPART
ncbi:amidohydrolase family protein [Candidatus Poriferisodalis sp.]|uniref:amidohydrolase family protein n=1 Tax=Candidatus Poriferisodalis sp. TaxID=3101277 RepID=UPI003B02D688